jgi:serine phosphatase RsbU (regulator of sigma subunit)
MKILLSKSILIILLFVNSTLIYSQVNADGIPFIKNYDLNLYNADAENWSVTQDHRGVMYFGNSNVIIQYDGSNWIQIPVSGQKYIYSLATGNDGRIYAGGVDDFGVLESHKGGKKVYKSLRSFVDDSIKVARVWKIYTDKSHVYFCTNHYIFKYSIGEDKPIKTIKLEKSTFWTYKIGDNFYCSNYDQGLLVYNGEKFENVKGGEFFIEKDIFSVLKWSDDELIVATPDLGLSIINIETGNIVSFNENKIRKITNAQLVDAQIYNGNRLNKEYYAFSTVYNGVYVIDKNGQVINHFNEENGLQNNLATNLYYSGDVEGILWVTMANGISSINLMSPIREFSAEDGLDGALFGLTKYNGDYYIASMKGVYKMEMNIEKGVLFKKIEDVEGKIIYALKTYEAPDGNEFLLASSIKDLYVIKNERAISLDLRVENSILLPSKVNPERVYVGTASGIWQLVYENGQIKYDSINKYGYENEYISRIVEDKDGNIWSNTLSKKQFISNDGEQLPIPKSIEDLNGIFFGLNQDIFFGTEPSIYKYNYGTKEFEIYAPLNDLYIKRGRKLRNFYPLTDTSALVYYEKNHGFTSEVLNYNNGKWIIDSTAYRIIPSISISSAFQDEDYVFITGQEGLFVANNKRVKPQYDYNTLIRSIIIGRDSLFYNGEDYFKSEVIGNKNIIYALDPIEYHLNNIEFSFSAIFYEREEDVLYRSYLEGFDNEWSHWSNDISRTYTNLKEGTYRFHVKAKNVYGVESKEAVLEFEILPPWYRTWWALIIYLIIAFVIVRISILLYTRKLQEDKKRLEKIVEERTAEIIEKNKRIEKQNIAITDSIKYAQRIQNAVLPDKQTSGLFEYFIYFKPKDIVSGDFYWVSHLEKQNRLLVVAADCTGHGVPGAFMSMLGTSFLNEIVAKLDVVHSEDVLNLLRENVITTLNQGVKGKEEERQKDGMDMALASIDLETLVLEYSGANNPLVLIRDGELIEYKPDKMPIGAYVKQHIPFTRKEIELQKNDVFYMFSDGYVDQFGGPQGRKYMKKRFKEFLHSIHKEPMNEQRRLLNEEMFKWMDGQEQIDDQIVIGMRLVK